MSRRLNAPAPTEAEPLPPASGRRPAPRILSRNADGFFDYTAGVGGGGDRGSGMSSRAGDTDSFPPPSPRTGAALTRDSNGYFIPVSGSGGPSSAGSGGGTAPRPTASSPSLSRGGEKGREQRDRPDREERVDRERDRDRDRGPRGDTQPRPQRDKSRDPAIVKEGGRPERDRDRDREREKDRERGSERTRDPERLRIDPSATRDRGDRERERGERVDRSERIAGVGSRGDRGSGGGAELDRSRNERAPSTRDRETSERRRVDRVTEKASSSNSRNADDGSPTKDRRALEGRTNGPTPENPPRSASSRQQRRGVDEEPEVPLPTRSRSRKPSNAEDEPASIDREASLRRKPEGETGGKPRGGTNEFAERTRRSDEPSSTSRLKRTPSQKANGASSGGTIDGGDGTNGVADVRDPIPRRGEESRTRRRPDGESERTVSGNSKKIEETGGGDEDAEKVAIRKAANDRKRKSQFIRDKKKKDAETLAREKEEAEEKERKRRERERQDLERKDAERRLAEVERFRMEGYLDIDESIVVPDYVEGVIRTLLADPTLTPTPDDFVTMDGFDSYQRRIQAPLQEVISDFLSERYIDGPMRQAAAAQQKNRGPAVVIFLKVMEATDIYIKGNGKPRECYCRIEFGVRPDDGASGSKDTETFVTEIVSSMQNPFLWNQHLNIEARNITDKIIVSVWDQRKDEFLGQVKLNVEDIVTRNERDGYVSKWFSLQPRDGKKKDKYVGGQILLEFNIDRSKTDAAAKNDREQYLETELVAARINFIVLYKLLLKACLALDMLVIEINESTIDLLSNESKTLLKVFGKRWAIGEAVQFISYVDLLFNKYKNDKVPVNALFVAYESIYNRIKSNPLWLTKYDKPSLSDLSDQMHDYYRTQVIKYKEFFPMNRPNGALESTILMWRMVFKSAIYRENHPNAPASFKDQMKDIIITSCKNRYEKLYELTSAIDEGDLESVVEGLVKLTQMLTDEIEMDAKYYQNAFRKDIDILKVSVEVYSAAFLNTIEEQKEFFVSAEGVAVASKGIFDLLKKIRRMDGKLNKIVPGKSNINAEKLFAPFMLKWLDYIGTKTMEWVANAVTADSFEPINDFDDRGVPPHSSSVMDVFTAVNHELTFIVELKWSNQVQAAGFYQRFAKTIYTAIEQYCDVIGTGELKPVANAGRQWTDLLQMRSEKKGPTDIASESCVKLCNIEFALSKLEDLNKIMDVANLQRTVKDYRATIAPTLKQKALDGKDGKGSTAEEERVKGAFSVQVMYAENIKPVTSAGSSSAYVAIRVPDGTVVPVPDPLDVTGIDAGSPAVGTASPPPPPPQTTPPLVTSTPQSAAQQMPEVLTGSKCEMARTRVIADSINPIWDEAFTMLLPPITRLEIMVYSKNLITNDPLCGQASLDLSETSRLKRKLADHHTHDVFLELEPQGRLLLRLTLEGEEEDVEFWFRRAREKLGRTRNDFVRSLCTKISPYTKEVLTKALKEQEAAPIKKEGFFSALQKTQYSNLTVAGAEISKPVSSREADDILAPLTDYLNKNLGLSARMATEVIKKIWEDSLLIIETALIPQLYGQIERDRRVLNARQVSVLNWTLDILKQFFHADGADLGLPIKTLETKKYIHDTKLIDVYDRDLKKLKQDYEKSLQERREKEYILRLIRLRYEKQEELTAAERDEGRKWLDSHSQNQQQQQQQLAAAAQSAENTLKQTQQSPATSAMNAPQQPQSLYNLVIKSRWRLHSILGKGAFGEVYLASDMLTNEQVAVKIESPACKKQVLKLEISVMRKLQGSFQRFLTTNYCAGRFTWPYAANINPTNSPSITVDMLPPEHPVYSYMVMELLGPNLSELRRRSPSGRFSIATTAILGRQMLRGIQALHEVGILHRDIKPGLIICRKSNRRT
ncbi:hypothetical protein BC830DRAFT_1163383 [Chytriomyces sp. MP71]|nr:hypothetical protein BC830DRAFT_1163383 [Chytriomyces sp. MP71]